MFTDPIKNLKALGLREDNVVADLGAGTGYYSVALGAMVPRGKVYAVELQKDYLETIKNKAKDAHLNNVEIIWGDIESKGGTKIREGVVDAVVVSNVLFQVENKDKFLEEIKRILKKDGKILLIDWSEKSVLQHNKFIPKVKALEMFETNGFVLDRNIDAGTQHYGMILKKI